MRILFFFFVLLDFALPPVCAQKNDTIYLLNGDRLTGELKKFEYGLLYLSTDAMQTVSIEFEDINTIYSTKFYSIKLTTGIRYFGSLLPSDKLASVVVLTSTDSLTASIWSIVSITPIRDNFFSKIDGSVGLGLSYTKASEVFQYNVNGQLSHRALNYLTKLSFSSILTRQGSDEPTTSNDVELNGTRFLPNKWFIKTAVKGQQNTELDLNHRFQLGIVGGYDFIRSNSHNFNGTAGVLINKEETIESMSIYTNFEGSFSLEYKWLQYRHPRIDIFSGIDMYPSFTIPGRYRYEYDLDIRFEIVTDLFLDLNVYGSYDSKHPPDNSYKSDYGLITSISYSF
jgi:hypothetical protein